MVAAFRTPHFKVPASCRRRLDAALAFHAWPAEPWPGVPRGKRDTGFPACDFHAHRLESLCHFWATARTIT